MQTLVWFEENSDGEIVEHPAVALKEALSLAAKSYAAAGASCPVFGLMYDADTYLEFFMDAPDSVGWQFEMPKTRRDPKAKQGFFERHLGASFHHEGTLKSWGEIEARITEYFTAGPAGMWSSLRRAAQG